MRRTRVWIGLALVGWAAATALAQDDSNGQRPARGRPNPPPGLFLTPKIMDLVMDRVADEMAKQYNLDEQQVLSTRDVLKARFPGWIEQNREQITNLGNEYIAILMGGDPPDAEVVADWAKRAKPLINDGLQMIQETSDEMRTYMTDEQQVLLDGQMAAMGVGMKYLQQRMDTWEAGGYDWRTEWPRSDEFKKEERARQEKLQREAAVAQARATGQPLEPAQTGAAGAGGETGAPVADSAKPSLVRPGVKDNWTVYVENFIKRYQLDEAQQTSARRFLRDQQEQRDKYLARRKDDISALEGRLKAAKTDEERDKVRGDLEKMNQPIENCFARLKDRLESLPTRKQRAAAAQTDIAARAKAENPAKAEAAAKANKPEPDKETKPKGE